MTGCDPAIGKIELVSYPVNQVIVVKKNERLDMSGCRIRVYLQGEEGKERAFASPCYTTDEIDYFNPGAYTVKVWWNGMIGTFPIQVINQEYIDQVKASVRREKTT